MKKTISLILIAASWVLILDTFNAGQTIVSFLLTGTIPGTPFTINASVMLAIYALAIGFTLARFKSLVGRIPY